MGSKSFRFAGLDFAPNKYAAILSTNIAPADYHLFQNFLAESDIGTAHTAPERLSGPLISEFWRTAVYDHGGENGSPSIIFEIDDVFYVVTPTNVRQVLGFEDHTRYVEFVAEEELHNMMLQIGYSGSLA